MLDYDQRKKVVAALWFNDSDAMMWLQTKQLDQEIQLYCDFVRNSQHDLDIVRSLHTAIRFVRQKSQDILNLKKI